MNPIQHAVKEVRFRIPAQILETVLVNKDYNWRQAQESIDSLIATLVLRPRLLVDCNLIGGTEVTISLANLAPTRVNEHSYVYRIPKTLTGGRSIISAINITFADPSSAGYFQSASASQCQNSFMLNTASQLLDAAGSIPVTGTANVSLVGENVLLVSDSTVVPTLAYVRCMVANDENMNHLQLRSYRAFAEAASLCVKAYIYNQYIVRMDMGEIMGGVALGRFKEIVESYADAEELYQTFLTEKLQKVLFMNDHSAFQRYNKLLAGGWR
jgi:hypothetical protein